MRKNANQMYKINGIDHVGIAVRNLDETIGFYSKVFGFKLLQFYDFTSNPDDAHGMGLEKCTVKTAFLGIPGGGKIELFKFKNLDEKVASDCPMNSLGKVHFAFNVTNIEEVKEKAESYSAEFLYDIAVDDMANEQGKWVYFKDPNGIVVELTEILG